MPICDKCKKKPTCKDACKRLRKELKKVTSRRSKKEISIDPQLIDDKLKKNDTGFFEWVDEADFKKKKPYSGPRFVRGTYIDKEYARIHKKYHPCYVYENRDGKKGKLKKII